MSKLINKRFSFTSIKTFNISKKFNSFTKLNSSPAILQSFDYNDLNINEMKLKIMFIDNKIVISDMISQNKLNYSTISIPSLPVFSSLDTLFEPEEYI